VNPFDIVVIGSGLAGMTAAHQLAREGHKVLLLEQHYKLGGLATYFKRRGGHLFDISRHGFPHGMVRACRRYWSSEIADRIVRVPELVFKNPQFHLTTSYDQEDCTRHLIEHFKLPPERVEAFFLSVSQASLEDNLKQTTAEFFEQFFPGRLDVIRFLLEPITIANGSGLEDPAVTFRIVFGHFMRRGIWIYQGRSDEMLQKMRRLLLAAGVEIRTRARVEEILLKNGRAVGVCLPGETLRANCVISNAGLKNTVLDLLPSDAASPKLLQATREVRPTTSSLMIFLGLRAGEPMERVGDALFCSTAPYYHTGAMASRQITSRTYSIHYGDPEKGIPTEIVALSNANLEDWEDLDEFAYMNQKRQVSEEAFADIQRDLPGVLEKVDWLEIATPRTFKRYALHHGAASYGTKFEGLRVSRELLPEAIPGLFHAGSVGIVMSGWVGTVNYGAMVAERVHRYVVGLDASQS
jgi:phytoene dehydrogenase-like protein